MPIRKSLKELEVNRAEMQLILGISNSKLAGLVHSGVVVVNGRGRYPLVENIDRCLRHTEKTANSAAATAEARVKNAKAQAIELATARKGGELIALPEAMAVLDELVGHFVVSIDTLPARIGRGDIGLRRRIEDAVFTIRNDIANHLERKAQALTKA